MKETHPHSTPRPAAGRWLLFAAASLALFVFVPFAAQIQRPVREALGDAALRGIVIGAVAAAALGGGVWAWRRRFLDARGLGVTLLLGAGLALVMLRLNAAAEALHVVQYFVVGVLAFRALSSHLEGALLYVAAGALTALVGVADEGVQWLTPGRFFDLRDVALNAGSGLAAQAWIAFALRPRPARRSLSPR